MSEPEMKEARRILNETHATGQAVVLAQVGMQLLDEVERLRKALEFVGAFATRIAHDGHQGAADYCGLSPCGELNDALKTEEDR